MGFGIRFTVEEYLKVRKQAVKHHMTIANFIRMKLGIDQHNYKPKNFK